MPDITDPAEDTCHPKPSRRVLNLIFQTKNWHQKSIDVLRENLCVLELGAQVSFTDKQTHIQFTNEGFFFFFKYVGLCVYMQVKSYLCRLPQPEGSRVIEH